MEREFSRDFSTFVHEMSTTLAVYVLYATVMGGVATWLEWRSLFHERFAEVLLINAIAVSAAVALLVVGTFINMWRSEWLGGERSCFFTTSAITLAMIGMVKAWCLGRCNVPLADPVFRASMLALMLQAPNMLIGFVVFFMWGKGL